MKHKGENYTAVNNNEIKNHQARDLKTSTRSGLKSREPPIYIYNAKVSKIIEALKGKIDINKIVIKNVALTKIALLVENIEIFKNVLVVLRKEKFDFYTRTPKSKRIHSWILKGVADDFEKNDIFDELEDLNLEKVKILKVRKIRLSEFFHTKKGGYAFLIQITNDSDSNNLININRLANQVVRWGRIRREVGIQCYNCQRIGHIAKYCNRGYRCVKCDQNHGPNECKIEMQSNDDKNKLFCVNCQAHGHPASYMGCPRILELKEKIKNKIEINKNNRLEKLQKISKFIDPSLSYANIVNDNKSNNSNQIKNSGTPQIENKDSTNELIINNLDKMFSSFKDNLMNFFSDQMNVMNEQIKANTVKINLIMDALESNNEP